MRNRIFFSFILFVLFGFQNAWANVVYSANTYSELVSSQRVVEPGQTFTAAIRMQMDPDWHIYWRNPGDSGTPPQVEWQLPQGVRADDIQWPLPVKIKIDPLMIYGYRGEVFLLVNIHVPADYLQPQLPLHVHLKYLACRIACVPGDAKLALNLPVGSPSQKDPVWASAISRTKDQLPIRKKIFPFQFIDDGDVYILRWKNPDSARGPFYFFPYRDDMTDHAKPQLFNRDKGTYQLSLIKSVYHPEHLKKISGILYAAKGWLPGSPKQTVALSGLVQKPSAGSASAALSSFWLALIFAFLGGMILNLMPCVLPVLSVKTLNFLEQLKEDPAQMWRDARLLVFGVLAAFWVLALCLILLQITGRSVGWGFQFQSPVFIIFMSLLFWMLTLNLLGFFEIGLSLTRLPWARTTGAFWEGVLVTVVATPCTAPFMGSALGYALTQPPWVSFSIFTALGLGMIMPFILILAFPSLRKWIPKPGPWMLVLKRLFAALLMGTVLWLLWVLHAQKGSGSVLLLAGSGLSLGTALWVYGKCVQLKSVKQKRHKVFILLLLVLSAALVYNAASRKTASAKEKIPVAKGIAWQKYSPQLVQKYREENKVVFLDFTARWCLTCQVNEHIAFSNKEVIDAFKKMGIMPVRADWTNRNAEVTQALARLGRNAIPVYVLYPKGRGTPVLLPSLLTPDIVLNYLHKLEE